MEIEYIFSVQQIYIMVLTFLYVLKIPIMQQREKEYVTILNTPILGKI